MRLNVFAKLCKQRTAVVLLVFAVKDKHFIALLTS